VKLPRRPTVNLRVVFRPVTDLDRTSACTKRSAAAKEALRAQSSSICAVTGLDVQTYIEAQALLDLVIRPHRDRLWDGEAELARALEIDGENRCGELFNR